MAKANNILELIGNTPELRINKLFDPRVEVWVKLERAEPGRLASRTASPCR